MFDAAVDAKLNGLIARGENGTAEYTESGVGDSRVALFFALVRNIPDDRLKELMDQCISESGNEFLPEIAADLFVLTLQTRDCRGGKGEKELFYKMLLNLYDTFPTTVVNVVSLLSEYGYYKDFFRLLELVQKDSIKYSLLREKLLDTVAQRLRDDEAYLENPTKNSNQKMSLCSKYAPREGKRFAKGPNDAIFSDLRKKLFPDHGSQSRVLYRKLIVKLTKTLDVPEIKMCAKRYRELSFSAMPSVCANKFRKAFLNEKVKVPPTVLELETGNRFPTDQDRIQCRNHLRSAIKDKCVKGKQLYPHEIVTQLSGSKKTSTLETDMFDVQWTDIRTNLQAKLAELTAKGESPAINVGKLVPLVDVSGSMSGIPMEVAIALGILVSEINHPSFRDRLITFDTNPSWVNLSGLGTIAEKVALTRKAPWGGSTSIEKAFKLILQVVEEHKLPMEEVPDLIIFSDMQFNSAVSGSAETQLEQIKKMFHDVGIKISGTPYPAPKIVFWNLRGDTRGYPAQAESDNVQMLSGYSPSLLKFVLEGAPLEVVEETVVNEDGETVTVSKTKKTNPYDTLRKVLDDERYDAIRLILNESEEGVLVDYNFTAKPPAAVVEADTDMTVEDVV